MSFNFVCVNSFAVGTSEFDVLCDELKQTSMLHISDYVLRTSHQMQMDDKPDLVEVMAW